MCWYGLLGLPDAALIAEVEQCADERKENEESHPGFFVCTDTQS